MPAKPEPTDAIDIQVARPPAARTSARRPLSSVTLRHLPGGIVSASSGGVTAAGATEEAALRELARKVEKAGPRTPG